MLPAGAACQLERQRGMISVVIPVYNEEKALPRTLQHLHAQTGDFETILVDGGSQDRTCALAAADKRVQLLRAPKGRASQMTAGARMAQGDWLLFLHADTLLPVGALAQIQAVATEGRHYAGGFRHRFSGNDWRLDLISYLDNWRCQRTRIIYGDQALFVQRALFERLGGFPPEPILEDVLFCGKLLCATRPILLDAQVITDARKFVQMGIWRSFARVLLIILCFELKLPIPSQHFFSDIR